MTAPADPKTDTPQAASEAATWERPVRDGQDKFEADMGTDMGYEYLSGDDPGQSLVVDVEGFEGPLDLLLAMARTQKIDLARISVGALADQYLAFVEQAKKLRLELAADYLVMAAWLAFLKSRLLIPKENMDDDEITGEELAQRLAFRLARLAAMRDAASALMSLKRLGRDVFARGMPEPVRNVLDRHYTADFFDLLKAYADQRIRRIPRGHVVRKRTVWSIKDARKRLEIFFGKTPKSWVQLDLFLEQFHPSPEQSRTVVASSLGAALEMARDGMVELRQEKPFGPISVRRHNSGTEWQEVG